MQGERPPGLPNSYLWAVWVAAFLVTGVLVGWELCGDLNCVWQLWTWEHCFPVALPIAILAFEGVLLAAVALSVQKSDNSILRRVAANKSTIVFFVLLILSSAGTSGFALLHYASTAWGLTICIGTTPGSGLIAFFSFFSFVWTLWIWGLLLLSSMVHEARQTRNTQPERPPSTVCPDVLRIENRVQMFCYYNTLAWEILTAVLASVIVLATLPFVVTNMPRSNMLLAIIPACLLLPASAVCLFYYLRNLAARWISLPCEDDSTSPRAWIDYVEAGAWKTRRSPRAFRTYGILIVSIALALIIYFWLGLIVLK